MNGPSEKKVKPILSMTSISCTHGVEGVNHVERKHLITSKKVQRHIPSGPIARPEATLKISATDLTSKVLST